MLRHGDVWRAIDRLAARHGLSPSGLARKAALDPTTFNKSKRFARDGKPRWPTTHSIAKVLAATDSTLGDLVGLIGESPGAEAGRHLPVTGLARAANGSRFDAAGHPVGRGWDAVEFPELDDPNAYGLTVRGADLAPVYPDGTVIVASPAAPIRRGDRLIVRTTAGEVLVMRLERRTAGRIELASIVPKRPSRSLARADVAWMCRIVWASQ